MDPAPPPNVTFQFGPFTLDASSEVLYRHDRAIPLRPLAVRLLRYLAERSGRVVSKQELLENVWQGVVTTEGVLKSTMSQVRQALGDDGDRELFIRTFHRRGYAESHTATSLNSYPNDGGMCDGADGSCGVANDRCTSRCDREAWVTDRCFTADLCSRTIGNIRAISWLA